MVSNEIVFYRLREYNDWEGEEWWYLWNSNHSMGKQLLTAIQKGIVMLEEKIEDVDSFRILESMTFQEMSIFDKFDEGGYMNKVNIIKDSSVAKLLPLVKEAVRTRNIEAFTELFYKGNGFETTTPAKYKLSKYTN